MPFRDTSNTCLTHVACFRDFKLSSLARVDLGAFEADGLAHLGMGHFRRAPTA